MVKKIGYSTTMLEGARAILASDNVGMDLICCLVGPNISDGNFRAVYEHSLDPTKVIKIEYGHGEKTVHDSTMQNSFCNVQEFLMWREIENLKNNLAWVKDWFAPVHWISPSGHILCMERTIEYPERARPEKIPSFLWDVKQSNFGWIGDKFVCHDYAHVPAFTTYSKRMQKVKNYWDNSLVKTL